MNSAPCNSARPTSIACQIVKRWAPSSTAKKARDGRSNSSWHAMSAKQARASSRSAPSMLNRSTRAWANPISGTVSIIATTVKNAAVVEIVRFTAAWSSSERASAT